METYEIKEGYVSRDKEYLLKQHMIDKQWKHDPYAVRSQKMTYRYAKDVAEKNKHKVIVDMGCGSGILLLRYFNEYNTIGYDLPINVDWLRKNHPDRKWIYSDFNVDVFEKPDMIICADVIEHIMEPNALMEWIKRTEARDIIISTPQRDNLKSASNMSVIGPPKNRYHIREWNYEELEKYVSRYFSIKNHWEKGIHQVIHCSL